MYREDESDSECHFANNSAQRSMFVAVHASMQSCIARSRSPLVGQGMIPCLTSLTYSISGMSSGLRMPKAGQNHLHSGSARRQTTKNRSADGRRTRKRRSGFPRLVGEPGRMSTRLLERSRDERLTSDDPATPMVEVARLVS